MSARASILGTLLLAGSLAAGCSTSPSKPRPTPTDVVVMKHHAWITGEKAKAGCYFSKESVDQITLDQAQDEDSINVLATTAGIPTTVANETSLQTVARATGKAPK